MTAKNSVQNISRALNNNQNCNISARQQEYRNRLLSI